MSTLSKYLPKISARRTYLIARRDFLGYVKTWGFWLAALGPFIGIIFGLMAPLIMAKSEPTRYAAILDETGLHGAAIERMLEQGNKSAMETAVREASKFTIPREDKAEFEKVLKEQGPDAAKDFIRKTNPKIAGFLDMPESKLKFVAPPATDIDAIMPYVRGEKRIQVEGSTQLLAGVLHIYEKDGAVHADYWSTTPTQNAVSRHANRYFSRTATSTYLQSGGLDRAGYARSRKDALNVTKFNPEKSEDGEDGQAVTAKDRIPYFVAAGLSMMLWFAIFTGAYMLLVSMVEEKINKVLEMLLASTRFSEIFLGKLIGVAALTLASLLPWIILGAFGFFAAMQFGDGAIADGLAKAVSTKMLIFLPVFFLLGYVFYGSIFIALGAMAESMQDASTLMTPMVLLLTACILIVPVGVAFPDSPLLMVAQYVPFSAPFAAIIRLPADPPLWQTLASVLVLVVSSILVMWLSARLFKHGVLSGGGMASLKAWFVRKLPFKRGT
ncbi:MAG: hypothetical protein COA69_12655 [Robiginitomaculum sp.]|nr:MAG: hypothetical protein COA69_12655 [Robiginitomaculum sp.]